MRASLADGVRLTSAAIRSMPLTQAGMGRNSASNQTDRTHSKIRAIVAPCRSQYVSDGTCCALSAHATPLPSPRRSIRRWPAIRPPTCSISKWRSPLPPVGSYLIATTEGFKVIVCVQAWIAELDRLGRMPEQNRQAFAHHCRFNRGSRARRRPMRCRFQNT